MARRSNVPKFGEWENESNVPYTAYFDKARKNRGNEKQTHVDPNNPAQFQEQEKKVQRGSAPAAARPNRSPEPAYEQQRGSRARSTGGNRADPPEAPRSWEASRSNNKQRGPVNEVAKARQRSEHGVGPDASPLHRNQQHGRVGSGGGVGGGFNNGVSPLHQGSSGHPSAPGRGRPKQGLRSIDDPDDSAVPKFGDWENSENYTEKFNKVLQERQNGPTSSPAPASYNDKRVKKIPKKKGFLCLSWFSKCFH